MDVDWLQWANLGGWAMFALYNAWVIQHSLKDASRAIDSNTRAVQDLQFLVRELKLKVRRG